MSFYSPEQCSISSSDELGDCIPLRKCQPLVELLRGNRTYPVTICSKELRTICCPLKFMSSTVIPQVHKETKIESRISFARDTDVEIATEIVKSK